MKVNSLLHAGLRKRNLLNLLKIFRSKSKIKAHLARGSEGAYPIVAPSPKFFDSLFLETDQRTFTKEELRAVLLIGLGAPKGTTKVYAIDDPSRDGTSEASAGYLRGVERMSSLLKTATSGIAGVVKLTAPDPNSLPANAGFSTRAVVLRTTLRDVASQCNNIMIRWDQVRTQIPGGRRDPVLGEHGYLKHFINFTGTISGNLSRMISAVTNTMAESEAMDKHLDELEAAYVKAVSELSVMRQFVAGLKLPEARIKVLNTKLVEVRQWMAWSQLTSGNVDDYRDYFEKAKSLRNRWVNSRAKLKVPVEDAVASLYSQARTMSVCKMQITVPDDPKYIAENLEDLESLLKALGVDGIGKSTGPAFVNPGPSGIQWHNATATVNSATVTTRVYTQGM